MHISEGILPLPQAAAYGAAATPFVLASVRELRKRQKSQDGSLVPLPLIAAILFAVTLLPIPVPVAGATSHMCAVPLLALLFGPLTVIAPTALVLALQALLFSHGGLTSLGANILTLGVVGGFTAVFLYRAFRFIGIPWMVAAGVACALADALVYVTDAVILGQALAGQTSFREIAVSVLLGFLPVQLPLAILEGALSAYALRALAIRQPGFVEMRFGQRSSTTLARSFAGLALASLLSFGFASTARAEESSFQGIDDSVMGRIAREQGRSPGPVLEWPSSEVTLFVFSIGFFVCGAVVGFQWGRKEKSDSDSSARCHALT